MKQLISTTTELITYWLFTNSLPVKDFSPDFCVINFVQLLSFADKIYDRAQMIELEVNREDLDKFLGEVKYRDILMQIWDNIHEVAPFAFRTLDEIKTYVQEAEVLEVSQTDALDEQLLQKILPKLKGADNRVEKALKSFIEIAENYKFNLSLAKANKMLATFEQYGFTSYF